MSEPEKVRAGGAAQLFLRYARRLSGLRRLPLVGPLVGWASGKVLPRGTLVWAQVQSGPAKDLWLHLNPRTGGSYFAGGGEPAVQAALEEHLRPGMVFFDIGANIGFFSLLGARLVGPAGRVVAFEADPEAAARLSEHVSRNGFSWIAAEQRAVWSASTTVSFARTDPATSPDRGLGHVVSAPSEGTIEVHATSLDVFARAEVAPDFLKCDVEGAEVEVFRGAQRLLEQKRPGILCEMHSAENRRVLLEEFARYRYVSTDLDEVHVLALPR
ncbi:MAG: FkbM family methyltransferase [Candidatus Acidiferrum sp.]